LSLGWRPRVRQSSFYRMCFARRKSSYSRMSASSYGVEASTRQIAPDEKFLSSRQIPVAM